jgi:hypothetical protein
MRSGLSPTTTEPEDEDAKRLITDDHDDTTFPRRSARGRWRELSTRGGRRASLAAAAARTLALTYIY